jgi:hypothetical protein
LPIIFLTLGRLSGEAIIDNGNQAKWEVHVIQQGTGEHNAHGMRLYLKNHASGGWLTAEDRHTEDNSEYEMSHRHGGNRPGEWQEWLLLNGAGK